VVLWLVLVIRMTEKCCIHIHSTKHQSSIWCLSFLHRGDHSVTAGRVSWVLSRWGSRRPGRPSSSRSDRGRWKPVGTFLYTGAFHDSVFFPNPDLQTITESENLISINYVIYWTGDNLPKVFKLIKTILQWMGFQQHEQLKNYLVEFEVIISKMRRGQYITSMVLPIFPL